MTRCQVHGVFNYVGDRSGFREIGEPDYQASPPLRGHERMRGAAMIRFENLALHSRQRLENRSHLPHSARSVQVLLDAAPVSEQANTVATVKRHLSKRKRARDGIIKLGKPQLTPRLLHFRAQEPPRIENEPHSLAPLNLKNASDEMIAPRGRSPRNIANLVSFAIVAHAVKFTA